MDCSNINSSGSGLVWDPHNKNTCAIAVSSDLMIVNTHNQNISLVFKDMHKGNIRDIDYNPNKPNIIVTGGDDCRIKFWDIRNNKRPLKTLVGHSHWVQNIKYNPSHDQLLVSTGSDNIVNLWRITSTSSVPWENTIHSVEHDSIANNQYLDKKLKSLDYNSNQYNSNVDIDAIDIKIRSIDQHEDSVYSMAWSACEPWMFVTLSYDGRIILSHVPSTEKYKILL